MKIKSNANYTNIELETVAKQIPMIANGNDAAAQAVIDIRV